MSEKHLTEPPWKALAAKQKLKDVKLSKALTDFAKCDAANAEAQLKALAVIEKEAEALKKEQKANKEVTDYLGEILKEVEKSRKAAELLKKTAKEDAADEKEEEEAEAEKKRKAAELKKADKEEGADEKEEEEPGADDEDAGADVKGALTGAMRKVKARQAGDPPIEAMVCQMGKQFGVLLGKKVGAGQAKVLKELLKGTGHKFAKGTCEWGKGDVYTFVLDSSLSGAAAGLKVFFKEQTGNSYKLRVGSGGVMEEDLTEETAQPANAAELFRKRFETLLPKLKVGIAAGGPKAQEMTLKAQGAAGFAKKGEFVDANKALDAAEALLGGPTVPPPKAAEVKPVAPPVGGAPTLSTYVKAKRDWKAAKAAAEKNIATLKAAILQQCDPELEAPVKAKIGAWDSILPILDDSVLTVIEEAIKEPDEDRQAERNKTLAASFTKMLAALHQHPLIPVADSNPFGKFAIRTPLESMLTTVAAAFGH